MLRAVTLAKRTSVGIDDVVDFLKTPVTASGVCRVTDHPQPSGRNDCAAWPSYTANGTYGQYFDSDEHPWDDAKMVVLELGGLEAIPSLLGAVMFSLIIYIENSAPARRVRPRD